MKLIVTTIIFNLITWSHATNITEDASTNKTKRTVSGQVQNYGENRQVLLYPENSGQTLANLYSPGTLKPVFEPDVPKQVAAQQVLYEFQQTPTNAVSNVHVNQFYQPLNSRDATPPTNTGPAQFLSGSETVATPVQHSALIRHGQNYAQVQYQPIPQHVQTQQYIPGKLLYVNGKITYPGQQQQHGLQQQQQQQQQHGLQQQQHGLQQQQHGFQPQQHGFQQQQHGFQQRPVNYLSYMQPQTGTHNQKYVPSGLLVRPMGYRRFQPPEAHQLQQITKPVTVPEAKEETEEEEEEKAVKEDDEEEEAEVETEEGDDKESYEGDDDDRYFGRYSFEDDEDHDSYREDDDDSERGSSRPVPKQHKKKSVSKPSRYSKGAKYSESYSSSSKYEKPMKKVKKTVRNPKNAKMHYKSVKYSKDGSGKPRIERIERIEGKPSQNIPVVHKQKIFKEKWFVTKSSDDSIL